MLAIMAGCAAFLYLKGTLTLGVTLVLNALLAGFVALGFYEMLSVLLIKYSPGVAVWAHMICFLLLFILALAILQAVVMQINKEKVDFGTLPERIGRPILGIVLGYIITGQLLLAGAMAPLPSRYPYPRFDELNPDLSNPKKALLSPDGFVASLFGTVSKGSFSPLGTPKSFAVLHAGFVDQLYLNRQRISRDVPTLTGSSVLSVPRRDGVWHAPDTLRDADGKPVPTEGGESLMLVRFSVRKNALKDAGKFTLSQLRLVCTPKTGGAKPLTGVGEAVYPIGYIGQDGRLERKTLAEIITVETSKVKENALTIDLAFSVPTSMVPTLLEFKRNNIVQVSSVASPEDAPQPIPFGG